MRRLRQRAHLRPLLGVAVIACVAAGVLISGSAALAAPPKPHAAPNNVGATNTTGTSTTRAAQTSASGAVVNDPNCAANTLAANDDGSTSAVGLGFNVNFYGKSETQLFVNNNGNVTFNMADSRYTPFGLTSGAQLPRLAPFFADVDTTGSGSGLVEYGTTTYQGHAAFCVDWPQVGYYSGHTDKLNTFQLIIVDRPDLGTTTTGVTGCSIAQPCDDFDFYFNYDQIQWDTGDASGGTDGVCGVASEGGCFPAHVGYTNGSGTAGTNFEQTGSGVPGAFLDGGPDALVAATNIGVAGRLAFSVHAGVVAPTETITLAPLSSSDPVNGSHTVSATVLNNTTPVTGKSVSFSVTSGPNSGATGTGLTNRDGIASFMYSDTGGAGTDTIGASFTNDAGAVQQATNVTELWEEPTLTLAPANGPADSLVSPTFTLPSVYPCDFGDSVEFNVDHVITWTTAAPAMLPNSGDTCSVTVPALSLPAVAQTPGPHTITATTGFTCIQTVVTCARYTAQTTFTVIAPVLTLTPNTGTATTEVTASLSFPGATNCPSTDGVSLTWTANGVDTPWGSQTNVVGPSCSASIDPQPPSGSGPGTYTITATVMPCNCSTQSTYTITAPSPSPSPSSTGTSPGGGNGSSHGPSNGGGTFLGGQPNVPGSGGPASGGPASGVLGTGTGPVNNGGTPPPRPSPSPAPAPAKPSGGSGGNGSAETVSPIWGATLAVPTAALGATLQTALALVAVLLLMVLIPFPAELFNATYDENQERIKKWWGVRLPWAAAIVGWLRDEEGRRGRIASLILVVLLGGALGAALDPNFGWNLHTLSLSGSVALALVLSAAASAVAVILFRRHRREDFKFSIRALPGGLVITLVGVMLSRLLNFEPGYLYGLILVASFFELESAQDEGKEVAYSSLALIAFSVAAWAIWIPVQGVASQAGAHGGLVFLADLLTAIFVIGIVRAVILLVPMRFLPGLKLFKWSRLAWAGVFGIGAFAMAEIMLLPESGQFLRSVAPVATTLGLFFGFGLSSILFWAYFRYRRGPQYAEATDDILT